MVKPVAAAVAGALISGVARYTVGAKTAQVDAFQTPALVQTVDGGWVEAEKVSYGNGFQPVAEPTPVVAQPAAVRRVSQRAPRVVRTVESESVYPQAQTEPVYREVQPTQPVYREVVREEPEVVREDDRSWQKTAMIIGGSAAAGAGTGGIIKGKKGALIGAAIGGGAASIYEATRRR
jgi:hypothetical protein